MASRNSARFLENGKEVHIDGKDLFLNKTVETVDDLGEFEVYPNRDSIPYRETYGLTEAHTIMRGTYRNLGWCDTFKKLVDLGMTDETPVPALRGRTYRYMMALLAGVEESDDVEGQVAESVGLERNHFVIENLKWLGLFEEEPLPGLDNALGDILAVVTDRLLPYKISGTWSEPVVKSAPLGVTLSPSGGGKE